MSRKQQKSDRAKLQKAHAQGGKRTTGTHKRFDPSLYQKHDGPAVAAVLQELDSQEIWAVPNPDKYGPDIVVYHGYTPLRYIEVEQRSKGWSGTWFPWEEIHIPERKLHLFQLGLPCEIWVLDALLKFAVVIPDFVLERHGVLKEFRNSKVAEGEYFLHVSIEECIQIQLGGLSE